METLPEFHALPVSSLTFLLAQPTPGKGKGSGYDKTKGKPGSKACEHALTKGKGAKVGLYRKCGEDLGLKQTGRVFNRLSIIDNLVNGEYYLPPGDKEDRYQLVRDVAEGYMIVGTVYEYDYDGKNRLISRHNLVRDEVHPYQYDDRAAKIYGCLTSCSPMSGTPMQN